jgi:ABC-2 type transport system permease protein
MFFKRLLALLSMRNKEFIRDKSAFGWNIAMPVLIVAGFAFAFSGDIGKQYKVGVINMDEPSPDARAFLDLKHIEFFNVHNTDKAIASVQHHRIDMLLDAKAQRYWINTESPKGYLLEKILQGVVKTEFTRQPVTGRVIRYIDWVIPGILAMNMMFSALFGVGYVIVRYRKNGMLKRLKATPITAFEYLTAQVLSRLILIMAITVFVFVGTDIFIDFAMNGSYFTLFVVFVLGAINMISLGLLIAARIKSEELAGGMLNLISWPMMFLSGVWFSLEGANPAMQKIAEVFPLTHVTTAARAVMVEGAGFADISYHLIVLVVQSAIFMIIGALAFRWD